jgi:hypothetical protein
MKALADQIRREEEKRERMWKPADRWRTLQATITWAEAQSTVRRNTPAHCIALQTEKLRRDATEKR